MKLGGGLFSEKEIQKMASPERLDTLVSVTRIRSWIFLAAVCLIVLELLVWSIFGKLSLTVSGDGILVHDGLRDVQAGNAGVVTRVLVASGQRVRAGDVVAEMELGDLKKELELKDAALRDAKSTDVFLGDRESDEYKAKKRAAEEDLIRLERQIPQAIEQLRADERNYLDRQRALLEGLITPAQLADSQRTFTNSSTQLAELRSRKDSAEALLKELEVTTGSRQQTRTDQIAQLEREVAQLQSSLASGRQVKAPVSGTVAEVMVVAPTLISQPVARLMTIEPDEGGRLEAVVYVPAKDAKRIKVPEIPPTAAAPVVPEPPLPPPPPATGARVPARVLPLNMRPGQFGQIVGEAYSVQEFPATPDGMNLVLRNQTMVKELNEDGAPFEVRARLQPAPGLPSGLQWTSGNGPPYRIVSGTLCKATFEVERKRPVNYVIPPIRRGNRPAAPAGSLFSEPDFQPGMVRARVSPANVKSEEFGFIVGEVLRVNSFPATPEGMNTVLRNDTMVEKLNEDGAPFEVRVRLRRDHASRSGFRWSSGGSGPDFPVVSGTPCTVMFEVERERPVFLFWYKLREILPLAGGPRDSGVLAAGTAR
jgi:HlyD family secretion protein